MYDLKQKLNLESFILMLQKVFEFMFFRNWQIAINSTSFFIMTGSEAEKRARI